MTVKLNRGLLGSILVLTIMGAAPLTLAGCDDKGPAEKAGEKIDKAAQDAKDAVKDVTK